jgi:electron transfer flavoprotein alpha subunit
MREILVLLEDLSDGPMELAAAARSIPEARVTAAVFGDILTPELLTSVFDNVIQFPNSPDGNWDAEYISACLLPWIQAEQPYLVLMLHTNNGMDLAPLLAAQCDQPLLSDCLSLEFREQGLAAVRPLYGGKVFARIAAAECSNGYLATLRPGAFGDQNSASSAENDGCEIHPEVAPQNYQAKRRCLETIAPEAGAVDITQAEVLVAVGRGIEEEENIEIVEALADAMGAQLACTRPVVDKQWLGKSRQVGTSGLTVKPRVYLTIGVSGSFQHLGGVKGGPFMVAINQDPAAPIFAIADVGVVGDLFDLVPLLEEKIRECKG